MSIREYPEAILQAYINNMKKIISLTLVFLTLISAVACDTADISSDDTVYTTETNVNTEKGTDDNLESDTVLTIEPTTPNGYDGVFKVGYARTVITPTLPLTREGYKVDKVLDDLYVTCVAVNDGERTVLLYTIDMQNVSESFCNTIASKVKAATNVSAKNIFISATHTHSSFYYSSDKTWKTQTATKMANIAKEAIDDLCDAEIYTAVEHTPGMAFVRRYINSDGSYSSVNPTTNTVKCVSEADDTLQVIRFVRDNKKDVVMTNWQGHLAHAVTARPNAITADLAYYVRNDVEKGDSDALIAFYAGASGNLNLNAPTAADKKYANYKAVGSALAKKVLEASALDNMTKVEAGKITATRKTYRAETQKDPADVLAAAKANKANRKDTVADRYIIARNKETSISMVLGVISFGDLGFISAPYEMFDNNGVQIKDGSPFKMTFILTNAWGDLAYIPSYEACTIYGGYETEATYFGVGVAEKLVAEYVRMLKEHKGIS